MVSALVEWLRVSDTGPRGPGSIPARVKIYSVYLMEAILVQPMTCLTLKDTIQSLMVGRKTTN